MSDKTKEIIQKRNYFVSSADVDFEGKIRVSALVNFFIQSAWQHAEHLGWGVNNLLKQNLAWVLSGFKIEFDEYANWKEELTIETWPKGLNRLFYLRDFKVYNTSGKTIARGTSNWLMIDIDRRRPKLQMQDNLDSVTIKDKHAIPELIPNLKFTENPEKDTDYEVRYSNIDINQHLTTTGYLDFMFDTLTPHFISSNRPKTVTANFLKEVMYGTLVTMQHYSLQDKRMIFRLIEKNDDKPYFCGELTF